MHDEKLTKYVALEVVIILSSYGKSTSLKDHLTTFKETISDLEIMKVKYDDKDLGLILLCLLRPSYSNFRDTILYGRETLTLDEVYDASFSKDKMKHLVVRSKA